MPDQFVTSMWKRSHITGQKLVAVRSTPKSKRLGSPCEEPKCIARVTNGYTLMALCATSS